jgi:PKD repeat protein
VTWTTIDPVASALSQLTRDVTAAFTGRGGVTPSFDGTAEFVIATDSLTVSFFDASTGGTIVSWAWDFGDGTSSTDQNPVHTYATAGLKLISLLVTNSAGAVGQVFGSVEVEGLVTENEGPVADFSTSINSRTVTFTDTSTDADGSIVSWNWSFGDGVPTAGFSSNVSGLQVTFTDTSTDPDGSIASRLWNFGDGDTDTATNPVHTYTTAGGYNVTLTVTDEEGNQDTAAATVSVGANPTLGIPFGPRNFWNSSSTTYEAFGVFTASMGTLSSSNIVSRITAARAAGTSLVLQMTGGSPVNYTTNNAFDFNKWKAKMDTYNTTAIKAAVAAGVADGTVLGADMLDEPHGDEWGGVITKAVVDTMSTYVRGIFGSTLPVGVSVRLDWRTSERFQRLDFVTTQYITAFGSVTAWRDEQLRQGALNGIAIVFSMNVCNGGAGFREVSCPSPPTGGFSPVSSGRCSMGAQQLIDYGTVLGPAGAGLFMWTYNSTYFGVAANQTSFATIASLLATKPKKSWFRP